MHKVTHVTIAALSSLKEGARNLACIYGRMVEATVLVLTIGVELAKLLGHHLVLRVFEFLSIIKVLTLTYH